MLMAQLWVHAPWSELALPLSHCSAGPMSPSPQTAFLQTLVQSAESALLGPSSHCSSGPTKPSPQTACWQLLVQAALSALAVPKSHCSRGLTSPSPHTATLQTGVHMALEPLSSPSSHSSQDSTTPLPQFWAVMSSSPAHEAVSIAKAKSDEYRSVSCCMTTPQSAWCLALISASPRYASTVSDAILVPFAFGVIAVSGITSGRRRGGRAVTHVTKIESHTMNHRIGTTAGVGFLTGVFVAAGVHWCGGVGAFNAYPKGVLGHSKCCFWVNRR